MVVGRIHVVVVVLVGESRETVPELMHHYRPERIVKRGRERVEVVDSSASVGLRVGEYDYMFVGDSAEPVCDVADLARGEVSVHVEGAEVRLQRRVFPYALSGYAHSAVLGFERDGDEVEPVPVALERFVREYGVDCGLRVRVEPLLLACRVPLGNYGYIYAVFGASAPQKVSVLGSGLNGICPGLDFSSVPGVGDGDPGCACCLCLIGSGFKNGSPVICGDG